jgi:hypothetical protein
LTATELGLDHAGRQLRRHRRGVLLELGQRLTHGLGQTLIEVAGHLAQLHHRPLHVPEGLSHLGGGAQLRRRVQFLTTFGVGEGPASLVERPPAPGSRRHPGQRERAPAPSGGADRSGDR